MPSPRLRAATAAVSAIVDVEMPLHVSYCAGWGLSEEQMVGAPEAIETMAYTRFVLERGLAGDLLDLQVALAPCLVGYGESSEWLLADPATRRDGNPYAEWIAAYTSESYRGVVRGSIAMLDRLGETHGAAARYSQLLATFVAATRLETAFWDMGWRVRVRAEVNGVVRSQVTRDAGLALPGRMMVPSCFQVRCEYGSRCWRRSEAARE